VNISLTVADRDFDPRVDDMDKDNRDDFTFAKLSDLKVPVTLRMLAIFVESVPQNCAQRVEDSSQFEGSRVPRTFTELLEKPELRFHGVQTPYVLEYLSRSLC